MMIYKCPVCGASLTKEKRRYVCASNHSFDIAKEGYVNLLLANQKKSSNPGDNQAMLKSRRAFFEQGYYEPLADAISEKNANQITQQGENFTVLDVGCGEGFYLWKLRQQLQASDSPLQTTLYGVDISKAGVKLAAKRDRESCFSVASLFQLPVLDESVACLTRIFAPQAWGEFARVLQPDGVVISVVPGSEHLMEIRNLIYDTPEQHQIEEDPECSHYFMIQEQTRVQFEIHLAHTEDILNLLQMTPYYWHMPQASRAQFEQLSELRVRVDCQVTVYTKR